MTLTRLLGTVTSRLSTGRSPLPSLDITTASTGLLCWRDLHPQEWQLASLHPLNTDSTRELDSSGRGRHPLELDETAHVVHKVHHVDLCLGAHDPDGAHDLASHRILLIGEHVFGPSAHSGARGIGGLLALRERAVAHAATMDAALRSACACGRRQRGSCSRSSSCRFFVHRASPSFCAFLAGLSFQPSGV